MTTLDTLDLFGVAMALGVRVEYADLEGRDGEYVHARRLIRLRAGMWPRLKRTVLAHECAHALYGDVPTGDEAHDAAMERRADRWAAAQLINHVDYDDALARHGGDTRAMGEDLGVVASLVEVFADTRRGDRVPLSARIR